MEGVADDPIRERLLVAGCELVGSVTPTQLLPRVREVLRAAEVSSSAFYRCFTDASDFHASLAERLIDQPAATARVEHSSERAETIAAEAPTRGEVVAKVAVNGGMGVDHILSQLRPSTRAQQLLASVADRDDAVADAARKGYAERVGRTSARQRTAMEVLLGEIGMTIRPPFTIDTVVDLLAAVSDGLVMRAQLEPGFDAATLLEDTVRLVFVGLLRHDGDPHDLDELLTLVVEGCDPAAGQVA